MIRSLTFLLLMPIGTPGAADEGQTLAEKAVVVREWKFGGENGRAGWYLGGGVSEASGPPDAFTFQTEGTDPIISSPFFEPIPVRLGQWIELCLRTDMIGGGEIYWSSRRETQFGGFTPGQRVPLTLRPGPEFRIYRVIPQWGKDRQIIRLRFDQPAGGPGTHSIRWIRIYEPKAATAEQAPDVPEFWVAGGVDVEANSWPLTLGGPSGAEVLLSSPFKLRSAERTYVALDIESEEDSELAVTILGEGFTAPARERIPARHDAGRCRVNLQVPLPENVVDASACVLLDTMTGYGGSVRVHSVEVSSTPLGPPLLLVEAAGLRGKPFARRDDQLTVFFRIRNWGGSPADAVVPLMASEAEIEFVTGSQSASKALAPAESAEWEYNLCFRSAGDARIRFTVPGHDEAFTVLPLRIYDRPPAQLMGRIPEPEPAPINYEVGMYYFPRWYDVPHWAVLLPFPERKPLLGWYVDLSPDVADWHINWCAESGISFFIYDWYWEEGRRQLYGALEQGYLNAMYRPHLKFCLLWANHNRPNTHSREDLLEVTRFWIENYFRVPEYYTIDGRPVMVIFAPGNITRDLGGEEAVREAFDAMRAECESAGVGPLYLVACGPGGERIQASFAAQGYDASSGYNYPSISGKDSTDTGYEGQIEGYLELWNQAAEADQLPHIPVLSGGWDSRPWHGTRARVRAGRNPDLFRRHCRDAKRFLDEVSPRNKKILFIEAWNEWGEGSYIEPHAEFGFDYLHAIRDTFTSAGDEWNPLLPSDVGLSVPQVKGLEKPAVQATEPPSWAVRVPKGSWEIRGRTVGIEEDTILSVDPVNVVEVQGEAQVLSSEPPEKWKGGTTLRGSRGPYTATRLPLAIDPSSVVVRDGTADDALVFREGEDYVFDPEYGGLARKPEGRIAEGSTVWVSYRHYLTRVDAVDVLADGSVSVTPGEPAKAVPGLPPLPEGAVRLAQIHVPFRCENIDTENVYLVPPGGIGSVDQVPLFFTGEEFLSRTRDRLSRGEPITVVFLGDSVTVGGDATVPGNSFVGRFEAGVRERYPEADLVVVNAGAGGTNSDYGLERLDRDVLSHRPDLVIVEFVNDMGFPPAKIRDNYRNLVQRIREAGPAECILLTPHFTRPAWMTPRFAAAVQAIREVAFEEKVAVGDVSASWEALARFGIPYPILLANGINHPDDRGHKIYADCLLGLLSGR